MIFFIRREGMAMVATLAVPRPFTFLAKMNPKLLPIALPRNCPSETENREISRLTNGNNREAGSST
jgi:hypothetical protein